MSIVKNPRVLIIGAGVIGLTTALCLRKQGFGVMVGAEKFAPQVTSNVAGALWEWPPAVYGHHGDAASLERSKGWAQSSYGTFALLARDSGTGVYLRKATFYFPKLIGKGSPQAQKMTELKKNVQEFVHDPGLIVENGVNPGFGLSDAYSHMAPMIDMDVYMAWLLHRTHSAGCEVVELKITGELRKQEKSLKSHFHVDVIVNCAGLGSGELAEEEMYPLRGALIQVRNDGKRFPHVNGAHCVSHDGSASEGEFIYIVPRGTDKLVLGGLAEPHQWNLEIGLQNYEPIRSMYRRCLNFLPILKNAEIDPMESVRVGLRPFRKGPVRLEREADSPIIHNFGHGGSGVSLSWGCAFEVAELARSLLSNAG